MSLAILFLVRPPTLASGVRFRPCGADSFVSEAVLILSTLLRRIFLRGSLVLASFFSAMRARLGLVKGTVLFCTTLPLWIRGLRSPVIFDTVVTAGFGFLMDGAMRAVLTESMRLAGLMGFVTRSGEDFGILTFLAWRAPASALFRLLGFTVLFLVVLERGPVGLFTLKEPRARLAALKFPAACLEALKGAGGVPTFGRKEFPLQDCRKLGLLVLLKFRRLCRFARPIIGLDRAGCERWATFVRGAVAGLVFLTC